MCDCSFECALKADMSDLKHGLYLYVPLYRLPSPVYFLVQGYSNGLTSTYRFNKLQSMTPPLCPRVSNILNGPYASCDTPQSLTAGGYQATLGILEIVYLASVRLAAELT